MFAKDFARALQGSIAFSDLTGKLSTLRVTCAKCDREAHHSLPRLIEQHGPEGKIADWLALRTADCPHRQSTDMSDQCKALCPDLARVL
jgi:hypothetical protein